MLEPLPPPMATRSLTNKCLGNTTKTRAAGKNAVLRKPMTTASSPGSLPQLSRSTAWHRPPTTVAAAKSESAKLKMASSPAIISVPASPIKTEPPATVASVISPSSKDENDSPKRRKREPIKLPPAVAGAKLSAKDLKRIKNRVSASRLRQRSQQFIQSMQDQVEHYRSRCEFLETFGDIELLHVDSKAKMETSDEEKLDGDFDPTMLTEAECIVLHNVLHS
ncbi:Basic-leucine zipper domain [Phytophthora cactorum]|nr:Basic-leucine zipper domain [Phytophthora cactorum]